MGMSIDQELAEISDLALKIQGNYLATLKVNMVAMLTELQLEIEKEKQNTKYLHYNDLENAESYNNGIDNCINIIQQKINLLKEVKDGNDNNANE